MALSRLALKNLHQIRAASSSLIDSGGAWVDMKRFMSTEAAGTTNTVAGETSDGKEVATSTKEGKQSKTLFSRKHRKRGLWRSRNDRDFVPALFEFFPSGLGNALIQATETMNRLFGDLNVSPWSLSGRIKEEYDCYKLRFDVPGLRKEDLKIVVEDGVLIIDGEHKEGDGGSESDDESSSARMYGYYHTNLVLPQDAKADEIKATLKNGVLCVVIPKTDKPKKEVKEVQIE